jgi:drug/metabolite transporter (DMT)-like permease
MKTPIPVLTVAMISVALAALAQVALKTGLSGARVQQALNDQQWQALFFAAATSRPLLLGVFLYGTSTLLWFYALARADLSYVYPMLGLGLIFTTLIAATWLGESVSLARWAGVVLIACGVVLVARS